MLFNMHGRDVFTLFEGSHLSPFQSFHLCNSATITCVSLQAWRRCLPGDQRGSWRTLGSQLARTWTLPVQNRMEHKFKKIKKRSIRAARDKNYMEDWSGSTDLMIVIATMVTAAACMLDNECSIYFEF